MVNKLAILLDTGFIYAFYNKDDQNHQAAADIYAEIIDGKYGEPFLLDFVFDELLTLIQARTKNNQTASQIGEFLLDDTEDYLKLIKVSNKDFLDAWDIFKDQSGKKFLSFTDAAIISVAKNLGISRIASLDRLFKSWIEVLP